jgi:broad specificity phosphatase PhoE
MRRTLYTCLHVFGSTRPEENRIKVLALPEVQEISDSPCDTGSDLDVLRTEFEELVELRLVEEAGEWNFKGEGSRWEPELEKLDVRARRARVILRELVKEHENAHVALVTHGGFLHFLTQDWHGVAPRNGTSSKRSSLIP